MVLLVDTTCNHSARKNSFQDLRNVNGVQCKTFKKTSRVLDLREEDHLWDLVMEDAKQEKLPRQMGDLFIIVLAETNLTDPKVLFEKYRESMSEDFEHQLLLPDNSDKELLRWMLLTDIQKRLQGMGKEVLFQEIGQVTEEMLQRVTVARREHRLFHECREIREEICYDPDEMRDLLQKALSGEGPAQKGKMTRSEFNVYVAIRDALNGRSNQKQIFINARRGTGKTFLLNRLLYYIRLLYDDAIGLSAAFTGIAAMVL